MKYKSNKPQKDIFEGLDWSCLMEAIGKHLENRANQLTVNSKLSVVNSQLTNNCKLLSDKEINFCLNNTRDLINEGWESWYRLRLYKLGVSEYMERAEKARKYGKDKPKYFSRLLKMQ